MTPSARVAAAIALLGALEETVFRARRAAAPGGCGGGGFLPRAALHRRRGSARGLGTGLGGGAAAAAARLAPGTDRHGVDDAAAGAGAHAAGHAGRPRPRAPGGGGGLRWIALRPAGAGCGGTACGGGAGRAGAGGSAMPDGAAAEPAGLGCCRPFARASAMPCRRGAALEGDAPVDLRANLLKIDRARAAALLAGEGIASTPTPFSPWGCACRRAGHHGCGGLSRRAGRGAGRGQPVDCPAGRCATGDAGRGLLRRRRRQDPGDGRHHGQPGEDHGLRHLRRAAGGGGEALRRDGVDNVERHLLEPGDRWAKRRAASFDRVLVDAPAPAPALAAQPGCAAAHPDHRPVGTCRSAT